MILLLLLVGLCSSIGLLIILWAFEERHKRNIYREWKANLPQEIPESERIPNYQLIVTADAYFEEEEK